MPNSLGGAGDDGGPDILDDGALAIDARADADVNDANTTDADLGFDCMDWIQTPDNYDPCLPGLSPALVLNETGTWTLDTTNGMLTPPTGTGMIVGGPANQLGGGAQLWAIIVNDFTLESGNILQVFGDNPLAIISYSSIDVKGDIFVNSARGDRDGPGSSPTTGLCVGEEQAEAGQTDGGKGGGGGGGGFLKDGKKGGEGNDNGGEGAGGKKTNMNPPVIVRGGCPGAAGGVGVGSGEGAGGRAGGAILLSALNDVTVSGLIQAGGAGGGRATGGNSGGGGGGSGGYIKLEAPLVTTANATLAANGGGGGAGIDSSAGGNGSDGRNDPGVRAGGGTANGSAGGGGEGGRPGNGPMNDAQNGQSGANGGGGGGGGIGYVLIHDTNTVP